jgi:hypothetical protein
MALLCAHPSVEAWLAEIDRRKFRVVLRRIRFT